MKKIIMTLILLANLSLASNVLAKDVADVAIELAPQLISVLNINTDEENNSTYAYVELEEMSVLYEYNNKTASILILDVKNNTILNTSFKKGSDEYKKISAALEYRVVEKKQLLITSNIMYK